jgi:hypothetical protein
MEMAVLSILFLRTFSSVEDFSVQFRFVLISIMQARPQWQGLRESPSQAKPSSNKSDGAARQALEHLYTSTNRTPPSKLSSSDRSSRPSSTRKQGRDTENTPPSPAAIDDELRSLALKEVMAFRHQHQHQQHLTSPERLE